MVASLTATVLGKAILAAGVAMFVGGAGLFGYAMLKGGTGGDGGVGDLGALSSSMKVRAGGGDRTGYVASNGEIMFDPIKKAAEVKKAEPEQAPEDKTAGEAIPEQIADAGVPGARPGALEHNLSGSKLSSSLGGGFGGKNIFSGNGAAPKFNEGMAKSTITGAQKGRLSASKSAATGRRVAGGKGSRVKANRAFGQLKVAKGLSMAGAGTTGAEGARSTAGTAFDGDAPGTGNVEGGPGVGEGAVTSPSGNGGAPDMTAPTVGDPTGVDMDPNSLAMLGAISEMAKKAGEMKKQAAMMMVAGLALIAIGIVMIAAGASNFGITAAIGVLLVGIGGMLVGMSIMMSNMAEMMKGMADSMSSGLAQSTGDINQDATNKYCIDKAYNEASDPKNCNPPDSVTQGEQWEKDNKRTLNDHQSNGEKDGKTEEIEAGDDDKVKP